MSLYRLVYCSKAKPGIAFSELKSIMAKAEENNFEANITGLLCYGDSKFLQVLEGGREQISEIYSKIVSDDRHTDPVLLSFAETKFRCFSQWAMRLVCTQDQSDESMKCLYRKHSNSDSFRPELMNLRQSMGFLKDLHLNL